MRLRWPGLLVGAGLLLTAVAATLIPIASTLKLVPKLLIGGLGLLLIVQALRKPDREQISASLEARLLPPLLTPDATGTSGGDGGD